MAAMTMPPCPDSVQDALDLLAASRRERRRGDAAASAKSPVVFLKARRLRAASRWRAALLRCRRRPPTHSQPHGPRKTARTKGQTCAGSRHDSETLSWPAGRRGARRGRVRAHAPRSPRRRSSKNRTHDPAHARDSESRRNRRPQARIPATGPVPRLRGRRRHPRDQAQRQEGGRPLRQDHEPHQEALLRLGQQVHQAERATSASFPHVSELQVAATASTRRHVFMKPSS